ncbi:hypothetical protein T439DRAFT_359392 [Meredithblackwellia eburnea MCA 4105]
MSLDIPELRSPEFNRDEDEHHMELISGALLHTSWEAFETLLQREMDDRIFEIHLSDNFQDRFDGVIFWNMSYLMLNRQPKFLLGCLFNLLFPFKLQHRMVEAETRSPAADPVQPVLVNPKGLHLVDCELESFRFLLVPFKWVRIEGSRCRISDPSKLRETRRVMDEWYQSQPLDHLSIKSNCSRNFEFLRGLLPELGHNSNFRLKGLHLEVNPNSLRSHDHPELKFFGIDLWKKSIVCVEDLTLSVCDARNCESEPVVRNLLEALRHNPTHEEGGMLKASEVYI